MEHLEIARDEIAALRREVVGLREIVTQRPRMLSPNQIRRWYLVFSGLLATIAVAAILIAVESSKIGKDVSLFVEYFEVVPE